MSKTLLTAIALAAVALTATACGDQDEQHTKAEGSATEYSYSVDTQPAQPSESQDTVPSQASELTQSDETAPKSVKGECPEMDEHYESLPNGMGTFGRKFHESLFGENFTCDDRDIAEQFKEKWRVKERTEKANKIGKRFLEKGQEQLQERMKIFEDAWESVPTEPKE